ncbi:TerD family protein [Clostridium algoriphilum]|uniref:TerD family protein n=1 Tax=Clostridium algoriphilum TaxID=198347 RepID=UPI001CF2AC3A|nr:TerD family protein [Clostridium algoriphilum]MCB2295500.1 TerD family protein [Clostridium algoriphilum]
MAIIIDNSNKKITSQKKQYGKIIVETSIRPENNSKIEVGVNQHINKDNVARVNNGQPSIIDAPNVSVSLKRNKNIGKRQLVDITKSIKLEKGQKLSLNQNCKNLSKLVVTLDFNIISNDHNEFDLDVSVFMVDINNKTAEKDFVFYENQKSTCGGIVINQDHNTSLKEAYNECIQLDLNLIPSHIKRLAFTATVYEANERKQNFGQVSDARFMVIAGESKQEILSYNFNDNLSKETAIVIAEIYRYKDEWKINCIGSGFRGGLEALCNNYGIETI